MLITIIVAYSQNKCIGKDNRLLWHLAGDMAHFKKTTLNQTVLMGKQTYLSLPKRFRPLPNRSNVVVSSQPPVEIHGNLSWYTSLDLALESLSRLGLAEVMVIGGAQIYSQVIHLAHRIIATEVAVNIEGDAYFPEFDLTLYDAELIESQPADAHNEYSYNIVSYTRKTYA